MYSIYNRSIPISFQNALYCGTESKQSNTTEIKQNMTTGNNNYFYIAFILLFLLDYISLPS